MEQGKTLPGQTLKFMQVSMFCNIENHLRMQMSSQPFFGESVFYMIFLVWFWTFGGNFLDLGRTFPFLGSKSKIIFLSLSIWLYLSFARVYASSTEGRSSPVVLRLQTQVLILFVKISISIFIYQYILTLGYFDILMFWHFNILILTGRGFPLPDTPQRRQ